MSAAEQLSFPLPVAGLTPVSLAWANTLLARWEHYLGPCERPFGAQAWALDVRGEPVALAVGCSTVSEHVAWTESLPVWVLDAGGEPGCQAGELTWRCRLDRGEIVELARLCAAPGQRWATQPMLRLWREVGAPCWPHWPVNAAVAYSANKRHKGGIYKGDGWRRVADCCGSSGGGAWSRKRYAGDAAHGSKSLWLWRYPDERTP